MPKRFGSIMFPSGSRLFSALIIASLLFSVLSAFPPPAVDAQDEPSPTPAAETQESGTDAGTGEAGTEVTATAEAQNSGVATYIAEIRTCPPGFDPAAGDASAALAGCVEVLPGVAVTLGTQNPNYPGDTRATGGDGRAAWFDIPLGAAYSVTQSIPQGYTDPWVYCEVTGGPGADQFTFFPATGGGMDVGFSDPNLANYAQAYCRWFNIPAGESARVLAKLAPVDLFSYLCPPGTAIEGSNRETLWQSCNTPAEGIQFALTQAQESPVSEETGDDGHLTLGVKPGQFTITQTAPEGYQLGPVYCVPTPPPDFPDALVWELFPVENGSISYNLLEDYTLKCEFYNLPEAETEPEDKEGTPSATPVAVEDETGSGSVIVHGYVCAAENYEDPFEDLLTHCPTPNLGMEVHLYSAPNQFSQRATIIDDSPISFPTVPSGGAELNFASDQYRLFCQTYLSGESNPPISGFAEASVDIDVQAGYVIDCYRFSFLPEPDDTYSTITAATHLCGPGYPESTANSTRADWLSACPDPLPGVSFYVSRSEVIAGVGTSGQDGIATLHAKPGKLVAVEIARDGYQPLYSYCEIQDEGATPVYVNAGVEPDVPLGDVAEPHAYYCDFFNAPSEGGNIVVTKWRCPEYYAATGASLEKLLEDCATPHDGVQITVSYASGESFTEQTASGKGGPATARFEGIPPGKAGLGEPEPQGHALKRAFCSTGEISQPALTVTDGYVEQNVGDNGIPVTIEAGKEIACHLFNVPVVEEDSPPEAGSVFVDKRICPPGFAAIAKNYVDIAMYCSSESGVEFKVTQGETVQSAVTGEDGVAEFTEVSAGALRITELPREGYDPPRVFCRETEEGAGETGELLPVTVDSWGVAYDLQEGYYLQCVWANLPTASTSTDPGTVILHSYTCPEGTGEYEPLETLQASCTDRPEGLKFTAGQPLSTPAEAATGSGGDVTFTNLAPGFNVVEVPDRQGYAALTSWCDYYVSATGSAGDYGRLTTRPHYAFLAGGYTLECSWFNVPSVSESDVVDITILTRLCPPGFAAFDPGYNDMNTFCAPEPGVEFTASNDTIVRKAVTNGAGIAQITEVPADDSTRITELPREGYDPPRVFCKASTSSQNDPQERTVDNWGISWETADLPDGAYLDCVWINFPAATASTDPGTVVLRAYTCPEGTGEQEPLETLLAECTVGPEGVKYHVSPVVGPGLNGATGPGGDVQFTDVPPGAYFVGVDPEQGHSVVAAWCDYYVTATGSAAEYVPLALSAYLPGGYTLECNWFNVPYVEPSTITILTRVCTATNFDPFVATREDILSTCTTSLSGVEFLVRARQDVQDKPYEVSQTTDATGSAVFENAPPDIFDISERSHRYQVARIFCEQHDAGSGQPGSYSDLSSTNDQLVYDASESGVEVNCDWISYELPTVDVGINVYDCYNNLIPGVGNDAASLEFLGANCALKEGVDFKVSSKDGSYEATGATKVTGLVVFENAPPGALVLTESSPDYRTARVFCGTAQSEINGLEFASDTAEYVAAPGTNVVCHWFNIGTKFADLYLEKYACPEEYDPQGHTYEEVLQACPTPLKNVKFNFVESDETYDDDTGGDGSILYEESVTPGLLTITETPPPDYSGAIVFCRDVIVGGPAQDLAQVPVENFSIQRQVKGGDELECHWFNYEVEYTKITIHKYGCEEGFIPGDRTDEALLQECPTPLEGVEFLLGGPAAEISRATDASGSVVWDEVQPGPVFITETPPASYTGATVICRVDREASAQVPVNDFTIELQVESGKSIECVWLNYQEHTDTPTPGTPTPPTPVPPSGGGGGNGGSGGSGGNGGGQLAGPDPDPDAPARLIIRNHTCEPGYEVHHPESDPVKDCEELTDDVEFTIAAEDEPENVETRVTGGDGAGTVEFGELKAGAYILTETLPEDIWLAFTYTCASDQREFQQENPFMPFAYAGPDGRIGVVLVAGETLECEWYNVPDQQSTVTITAYWCEEEVVVPSTCDLYTGGIDFTLMPLDDGEDIPLLTGEDGTATAEAEGIYELVQEGFDWCFAESEAMGTDGNLTIGPGEQVAVSIYNCGPQPGS